jgi:hypothetical protein
MADDDEPDYEDEMQAAEMQSAWESFLSNEVVSDNTSEEWGALVNQLQDLFSLGYDIENGLTQQEREDYQQEFRDLLDEYDIDLYDYDWDDWREWYDAQ